MAALSRLPDAWHDSGQGFLVPWMRWTADWPPAGDAAADRLHDLLELLDPRLAPAPSRDGRPMLDTVAAALAIDLQAGGSPDVVAWLHALRDAAPGRFAYPFLDAATAEACGRHAWRIVVLLASRAGAAADARDAAAAPDTAAGRRTARAAGGVRTSSVANARTLLDDARRRIARVAPPESVARTLAEALQRRIPVGRLTRQAPFFRLGHGWRQQRVWRQFTSHTSHVGTVLSTHKHLANRLLADAGFPVARQVVAHDEASAVRAAQAIGYPVVVKPSGTDYGTAVSTGLASAGDVVRAFRFAKKHGIVLVEQQLRGADFRLTVVNGRCTSVLRRDPPSIEGDGERTVAELVSIQALRRAGHPQLRRFRAATLDDPLVVETLRMQRVAPDDVPEAGRRVLLRTNANVSSGGSFEDVTRDTHEDNLRLAERAAACLGLDVAGVDLIVEDIGRPWRGSGGGLCEVNATPMFVTPDAPAELLDHLFPHGGDGRIPVVLAVGESPIADEAFDVARAFLGSHGVRVGSVERGVVRIGDAIASCGGEPFPALLGIALGDAITQAVVVRTDASTLIASGLALPYCDLVLFDDDATRRAVLDAHASWAARIAASRIAPDAASLRALLAPLLARCGASLAAEPAPSRPGVSSDHSIQHSP